MQPDFLIIGAQKCGTSWLHSQLRQHPALYLPQDKDSEFFSYQSNLDPDGFKKWCQRFAGAAEEQTVGDANAAYFWTRTGSRWARYPEGFNQDIPGSVRRFLGADLKLVVLLRDPVDRAVAAYLHHIRHGSLSADQPLLRIAQPLGIIDMGFYGKHLEKWLAQYPQEQILVIRELFDRAPNHAALLARVCEFLKVDTKTEFAGAGKPVFPGFERFRDESGIWVKTGQPGFDPGTMVQRPVPLLQQDGEDWIRLVHASELQVLERIYQSDQDSLDKLLGAWE